MSFLIVERERYALEMGDTTLGGNSDELFASSPLSSLPPFAVVTCDLTAGASIRALNSALSVMVTGKTLGSTPLPLQHGDRIEVGGLRILFGDARLVGSTVHISGMSADEMALLAGLSGAETTADTGGRLTHIGPGKVYHVPPAGLEIGRDPECGIVLNSKKVSRRHCVIMPGLLGYAVTDRSANGVYLNGTRVDGVARLGQGDRLKIADFEFVFEADAAQLEPARAKDKPTLETPAPPSSHRAPLSSTAALASLTEPIPVQARPDDMRLRASLEVLNDGPQRGTRIRLDKPVVHVGRGSHSDVRFSEDSVSSTHATLLQRGREWHVLDLGSRNGTYVDGQRVTAETLIPGVSELHFGNIRVLFRPIAGTDETPSTRSIVGMPNTKR